MFYVCLYSTSRGVWLGIPALYVYVFIFFSSGGGKEFRSVCLGQSILPLVGKDVKLKLIRTHNE